MSTYLFIFYCVFLLTVFVIPSCINYKRTGINPLKFNKEESTINYVGKIYKVIAAVAFLTITLNAFTPSLMPYFAPLHFFSTPLSMYVGFGLLHLSFIIIFIAQRNMANEWRIGIDKENKVTLIKKGLFRVSRNPIFLGVIILFVGLFLIIPNSITSALLSSGVIVIQIQVRLEEEFLLNKLGVEYKEYMQRVKRWLL